MKPPFRQSLEQALPYITKDGSEIRELLHPTQHALANQSLAEALVPPGVTTLRHLHWLTEEIYHITQGAGLMSLGDQTFRVTTGDSIAIASGTPHCIANDGATPLHILCCCAPAYSHDDTFLL